jgi:hypothetical protein
MSPREPRRVEGRSEGAEEQMRQRRRRERQEISQARTPRSVRADR